ncbi:PQQ-dependent sugar dehydrogenase [Planktotalea arctica]|uniref:PQQ-dependent sugar dehydrogenase n=1 Tax=Planktotalea arctica TaxID=1481893 RepID=UPI000A171016|nr:PQQ-dependent sugar dehydrogenase [Planktotalea arctica]
MPLTRRAFTLSATSLALLAPSLAGAQAGSKITMMANGFDEPWALGFTPDGILVTEREGRLIYLSGGARRAVLGLPVIAANGQGGLLDLLIPRDFARSKTLFMTYAKPQGRGEGTAVMRAVFDPASASLSALETIFEISKGSSGGFHFGSRIVEARDGTLFVSVGDRGNDASAQNLSMHNGSILRITKDGAAPADNPFTNTANARNEIWSYGHRNPQGMTLDLDGRLWAHEHGARGGDEVNRITKGANYGWPVISYGTQYSGRKIGEGTAKDGLEQPVHYWDPSIAPSGYMIYSGKLWPQWRGHHFVGSLKFDYIARLSGSPLSEVAQIKSVETERIRDIREAPDGSIWFLSVGNGALYKITPD